MSLKSPHPESALEGSGGSEAPIQTAVVIATKDRPTRPVNHEMVASLNLPGCDITYTENLRTAGASGSWNTALGG